MCACHIEDSLFSQESTAESSDVQVVFLKHLRLRRTLVIYSPIVNHSFRIACVETLVVFFPAHRLHLLPRSLQLKVWWVFAGVELVDLNNPRICQGKQVASIAEGDFFYRFHHYFFEGNQVVLVQIEQPYLVLESNDQVEPRWMERQRISLFFKFLVIFKCVLQIIEDPDCFIQAAGGNQGFSNACVQASNALRVKGEDNMLKFLVVFRHHSVRCEWDR